MRPAHWGTHEPSPTNPPCPKCKQSNPARYDNTHEMLRFAVCRLVLRPSTTAIPLRLLPCEGTVASLCILLKGIKYIFILRFFCACIVSCADLSNPAVH